MIPIYWYNVDEMLDEETCPEIKVDISPKIQYHAQIVDDSITSVLKILDEKGQLTYSLLAFDTLFTFTHNGETYSVSKLSLYDHVMYMISCDLSASTFIVFTPKKEIYVFESNLRPSLYISAGEVTAIKLTRNEEMITFFEDYILKLHSKEGEEC